MTTASMPVTEVARAGTTRTGTTRTGPAGTGPAAPALSHREVDVLLEWLRSDSKAVAAQNLFISVGTLNTHLARVRAKYVRAGRPASTKAALVVRALQDGLTTLDQW